MNNFKDNFNSFRSHFDQGEYSLCLPFLEACFSENARIALRKIYEEELIFNESFIGLRFSTISIPREYLIVLGIIRVQQDATNQASVFLQEFSKEQLLQGSANYLEKRNAEFKYNSRWMQKYLNGQENYLETERQAFYSTNAGIQFQHILEKFYNNAPEEPARAISWNLDIEEKFAILFYELGRHSTIQDIIERHLYFNWSLECGEENEIKTNPPFEQREGTLTNDISNLLKGKTAFVDIEKDAERALLAEYMDAIKNPKPHPESYWKHVPNPQSETEMKAFAQAMQIDIKADQKVMQEMLLFKDRYFPGVGELNGLMLQDGTKLPLKETFRVLAFLSELSKEYITQIDNQYNEGIKHFAPKAPQTFEGFMIDLTAQRSGGDSEAIKETIRNNYSEKLYEEQQYIIWQSKNKIDNNLCLIKQSYDELIKTIQWLHQYEADFIRKVIDLFVFDSSMDAGDTRLPFFRIGEKILWFPNMVAWTSWSENLIETLVARDLITMHQLQTQLYEASLKVVFKLFKFDIIENDSDKTICDSENKSIGDFDLLAHKNGHILHLQLKLTHTRNSFRQRYKWRSNALKSASRQLTTGNDFVRNNPDHTRKILGLSADQEIKQIHSFIVSNVFQFDHERIGDVLKVSFYEIIQLLLDNEKGLHDEEDYLRYKILDIVDANPDMKLPIGFREWAERKKSLDLEEHLPMLRNFVEYYREKFWPNVTRDVERLAQLLNENRLWKQIERTPISHLHHKISIGDYSIIVPTVQMANIGVE